MAMDFITGLFTLAAALIVYMLSKSIWLAVIVTVAAAMIVRSIKPIMQEAWEMKHPPKKIIVLSESSMDSRVTLGARILLITQGINLYPGIPERRALLDKLLKEGIDKLRADSEVFDFRYSLIQEMRYPLQISYSTCGKGTMKVRICYFKWMKASGLSSFKDFVDKRDVFTLDLLVTDAVDGRIYPAMLQAVFDRRLPISNESIVRPKD